MTPKRALEHNWLYSLSTIISRWYSNVV